MVSRKQMLEIREITKRVYFDHEVSSVWDACQDVGERSSMEDLEEAEIFVHVMSAWTAIDNEELEGPDVAEDTYRGLAGEGLKLMERMTAYMKRRM